MPGPSFRDKAGKGTGLKYPTGKTKSSGKAVTTSKPSKAYKPPVQRGSSRGTPLAAVAPSRARAQGQRQAQQQARKVKRRQAVKAEAKRREQAVKRFSKTLKKTGGLAEKLDRGFDESETITPKQAAIVMESEGLPGRTFAEAIIPGESGFKPGIKNPDDGYPSLVQITPSVQSAETKARFDKIASKRKGGYSNPIVAAKQAKVLAAGNVAEGGTSNYVADTGARPGHLPGGKAAARRKLYGKPDPQAKRKLKQAGKKLESTVERAKRLGIDKLVKDKTVKEVKAVAKTAKKGKPVEEKTKKPVKPAQIKTLGKEVQKKFGVTLSEGPGKRSTSPVPSSGHTADSLHYQGAAYDITGTPEQMMKTYNYLKKNYGSDLEELIYDPAGEAIFDGQVVQGAQGGHETHVHVAETTRAKGGVGSAVSLGGSASGALSSGAAPTSSGAASPASSGVAPSTSKKTRRVKRRRGEELARRRQMALSLLGSGRFAPEASEDPLAGFERTTIS